MTYKYAMAASRNIPAVKVFQSVDNSKIVEFVTRLGLTPEIREACPTVKGLTLFNFSLASFLRPEIFS